MKSNQLIALVKSKFPSELNLKLEETRDDTNWTLDLLRKTIERFIKAREKTEENYNYLSSDLFEKPVVYEDECTGDALISKDVKLKCVYCESNHWSDECQRYKTLSLRKEKLKGRCFICLSKTHFVRQCKSNKQCFHCKRKNNHHTSLCPTKFEDNDSTKKSNEKDVVENELADIAEIGEEISIDVDQKVVMKTANAKIKNPNNGREEAGVVLLDTGCKRTDITAEKARCLGTDQGSSKLVKLNTFGNDRPSSMYTKNTVFCIKQNDGKYKRFNAKICKNITGKFTTSPVHVEKYKHIWNDLTMADELPDRERTI
ncbi:MAG: hypothetical protein MK200_07930 [Nitrosopumilus sp.]|nr:hypothetical protein [Nitrosopumilus sp.]